MRRRLAQTNPFRLSCYLSDMERLKHPRHTNGDHHNGNFGSNLVRVTIHILSQGSTILEQSNYSNESD
jgi:hypothetical protein